MDNGMETEKNRLAAIMKYSIITINYNNKKGLLNTLKSVVGQSYHDYEYIVIDGGSTDGSVEVIREYESHIDYWISEPDKGIYNAMNKGILQAHGEYLNFMNSGDSFHDPGVLEWVATQNSDYDIAIGNVHCLGINVIKCAPKDEISMMDLYRNHLSHQAAFIRRSLFMDGLYDESFKLVSDWSFFIEKLILKNCSYRYLDRVIANYDMKGVSTVEFTLLKEEEKKVLQSLFPERVLKDYEKYRFADSPLLDLIPELNKTAGFHQMVVKLVRVMLRCYHWLK